MNPGEVEKSLKSMTVLVDSNEQDTERARERYAAFSVPYARQKLDFGDYTYNFITESGVPYYRESDARIFPDVVIERKADLTELSNNLIQEKARFEREFKRARDRNAKIYLLVENATWQAIYAGHYGTKAHPNAYKSALLAMFARYGITPIFCPKELSGQLIHDILYRELKERLEGCFYG